MKITPTFVAASILCAAPFALAIRDDLTREERHRPDFAGFHADDRGRSMDFNARDPDDRDPPMPAPDPVPPPPDRRIAAGDLDALVGKTPATLGPLFGDLAIGAPSTSFLSEATRERIEWFQHDHDLAVDYDFDTATLNGVTLRLTGDESDLRDAMIAVWGTPRRLSEDKLVWTGADNHRAVYSAMIDGADLRFERYTTVDQIIAPADKTKLGIEPFPLVGAKAAKLEDALGPQLEESAYDDGWTWSAPGVGQGEGNTTITARLDDTRERIIGLDVTGMTDDTELVRDALIAKWGPPRSEVGNTLSWRRGGVQIEVEIGDHDFFLRESK